VIDLSLSGADVKIRERPFVGALVQLGQLRGKVVRHSRSGVAIESVDVPDAATLTDRLTQVVLSESKP
jgi:hypothetical protein